MRAGLIGVGLVGVIALAVVATQLRGQDVAPELEPNLGWLNTDRPLRFERELRGHVVLLDFWTYCCINCMHVLPELEGLEHKYADEPFVVVGVHSAKFENEATRQGIDNAIKRYGIAHPVVMDDGMGIWRKYGVRAWPTLVLIGADGKVIGTVSGEGNGDVLDREIAKALAAGRKAGTLADEKVRITRDRAVAGADGLYYPGKVLGMAPDGGGVVADGALFVADSSHNRVLWLGWPDETGKAELVRVFGGLERGFVDGGPDEARFNDPQGLACDAASGRLYVADTKNHAIREIDLASGVTRTVVGNGEQGRDRRGGRAGRDQELNSPWDVALSGDGGTLYVAMAGPHQLWRVDPATGMAKVLAGSGIENIADGPAAGAQLAQPSGLALSGDGRRLYFADSEVSAVRYLDLMEKKVHTIIGTGLFDFGDVDGAYPSARLQHPLGVAVLGDKVLVADTYNHKIKLIEPDERRVERWLEAGLAEPGGLSVAGGRLFIADTNNGRVLMVDVKTREVVEVSW